MSIAGAIPVIDPQPILQLINTRGGECSFDEAIEVLQKQGLNQSDARDGLWRLLSQGIIEFTSDRKLKLPRPVLERAAG